MIENGSYQTAIPKEGLRGKVVDAVWVAEFDIPNGLVQWKVGREKRDQNVTSRPVLDIYRSNQVEMWEMFLKMWANLHLG